MQKASCRESYCITAGPVDVVITDRPGSLITVGHFEGAGLNISDYHVIVVKQGYLFPELRENIRIIHTGADSRVLPINWWKTLEYKNIIPPVYPLRYAGKGMGKICHE